MSTCLCTPSVTCTAHRMAAADLAHGEVVDHRLTREGLIDHAEKQAMSMLGVSFAEACERLDAGEWNGTIAQAELTMLRCMLRPPERLEVVEVDVSQDHEIATGI